jgi:deoxyinosine 3'endonuclease (endonuclease V)
VSRVFYPGLKDHQSVLSRPPAAGMAKKVLLVSHASREESVGGRSKVNLLESGFLLRLARHLVRAGNSGRKVTLLTAYAGQMLHMMKARKKLQRNE